MVTDESVGKELKSLNAKKSTGTDNIPAKLLKYGAETLSQPIAYLINKSFSDRTFPSNAKKAEVVPIHKKNDNLSKSNYRPISILSSLSKLFEKIIVNQMMDYFNDLFSCDLSGFRKHHGCEDVLLNFVESVKLSIDNNEIVGAVLTDLSKAFDCIPHRLLIAKLYAYGVNKNACILIMNYFCNRYQRVKLNGTFSDWMNLYKGCPQGYIFGPFMYNVFSNDLLLMMKKYCNVFNYADDNTISCTGNTIESVKNDLALSLDVMMNWFVINGMKANPDKFQLIFFGKSDMYQNECITLNNLSIKHQTSVKLLGVNIDSRLKFDIHISEICRKAGYKLNVLGRLSKTLDIDAKILLFRSFILSFFNYCPTVWHHCDYNSMKSMEKIQKRALRYIFNDFNVSYSELCERANISMVYEQRILSIILQVYKSVNNISPSYMHDWFQIKSNGYVLRNNYLELPNCNSKKYGINSFRYQGAKLWNSIPYHLKQMSTITKFKKNLYEGTPISKCFCSVCVLCRLKVAI